MQRTAIALAFAALYSASINAAVTISVVEDGANVVATVSGSVDTDAYPPLGTADATSSWIRGSSYQPGFALSGIGIGGSTLLNAFTLNPTSTVFSTGSNYTISGTGTLFGIGVGDSLTDYFYLSQNYVSGSALSSSATFPNLSFASMGLIEGVYEFSWGSGANLDTATLTIGGDLPLPSPSPVREYSGTLPSGATGSLSFVTADDGCEFDGEPQFLDTDSLAVPLWLEPIDGIVQFTVNSCSPGATVTFTLDYGTTVPEGSRYWKAGEIWHEIPASINGSQIEFTIRDGGIFDDDGLANGQIVDPSGAATGSPPLGTSAQSNAIPTVSVYGLVLTALGLLVVAGRRLKARSRRL